MENVKHSWIRGAHCVYYWIWYLKSSPISVYNGGVKIMQHDDGKCQVTAENDSLFDMMYEGVAPIFQSMEEAKAFGERMADRFIEQRAASKQD